MQTSIQKTEREGEKEGGREGKRKAGRDRQIEIHLPKLDSSFRGG